jgi:hypothetical protein
MEEKDARVCSVYGKAEHCWNAGDGISEVTAKPIMLSIGRRLLLVSALSMGGSDGTLCIALLDEQNQQPVNLLPQVEISSANSGEWEYLQIEKLSPMPIIVTADPVWNGVRTSNVEGRSGAHQYIIRVFMYDASAGRYVQVVDYATSRKQPGGEDIIKSEKPSILTKLKGATAR